MIDLVPSHTHSRHNVTYSAIKNKIPCNREMHSKQYSLVYHTAALYSIDEVPSHSH